MQAKIGIAGSASIEGTTRTVGIVPDSDRVVKRAMWIWIGAVVLLTVFHVGGSKL